MICAFCYKIIESTHEKLRKDEQLLQRFIELVARHFGKTSRNRIEHLENLKSCQDCNILIGSFCNHYHELKCLELRMEWKVRKLLKVISAAERVPSRIHLAKQYFDNSNQKEFKDVFTAFCEFRKDFKSNCRQHLSTTLPKILIPDVVLRAATSPEVSKNRKEVKKVEQQLQVGMDKLLIGWISTLVGVLWLGFSCWELSPVDDKSQPNFVECDDDDELKPLSIEINNSVTSNPLSKQYTACDLIVSSNSDSFELHSTSSNGELDEETTVSHQPEDISALVPSTNRKSRRVTCELCRKVLCSKESLKCHKLSAHTCRDEWPFSCTLCNRKFIKFYYFEKHTKTLRHQLRKSFKKVKKRNSCFNVPKNIFPVKLVLPQTKVESESCSETSSDDEDRDFSESSSSTLYKRTRKKRSLGFLCNAEDCSESFKLQEELDIHKILHGEFPCKYCDHAESYAPKLALHEIIHSEIRGDQNFKCARCPYRSAFESRYINHHLRRHLGLSLGNYICNVCKVAFTTKGGRCGHMLSHHKTEGVDESIIKKCEQCSAFFLTEEQLSKHIKNAHNEQKSIFSASEGSEVSFGDNADALDCNLRWVFNCQICSKSFGYSGLLRKHEVKAHGANLPGKPKKSIAKQKRKPRKSMKQYICDLKNCPRRFQRPEELERHKKQHGTFSCCVCSFEETYAPKLAMHELTHQRNLVNITDRNSAKMNYGKKKSKSVFNCARCSYRTSWKSKYLDHHLEHHLCVPSSIVSCQICKWKPGFGLYSLTMHSKTHHDIEGMASEEVAKCDECPAYFRKYIQLFSHEKKMHNKDPLKCVDCGRKLGRPESLQNHRVRVHKRKIEDFQFVCDDEVCGRKFETRRDLDWHKVAAKKKRNSEVLICSVCGKKCSTEAALNTHMRVHDENKQRQLQEKRKQKKHVCELCGKAFLSKKFLDVHKLSHSGPSSWEYCCLICEKRCLNEDKLFEHLRTHTREKPYFCQFCGEEYGHAHNLRNHMNNHHGANVVPRKYDSVNLESRKGKKLTPRIG